VLAGLAASRHLGLLNPGIERRFSRVRALLLDREHDAANPSGRFNANYRTFT
jgi:hypothetical protein